MKVPRKVVALIATIAMFLGLSACGDSGNSSNSGGDGLTPEAQQAVDAAFEGSFGAPPSEAPPMKPGQNIWLVTNSAQYIDFEASGQIVDAAERIGWDLTVFDGQFNTDTMVSGLRQAIADQADGVIAFGIDCAAARAGYQDLADAGIPVVGFESVDCNEAIDEAGVVSETGEPGAFDATLTYDNPADSSKPLTFVQFFANVIGPYQALGIIEGSNGGAKLIKLKQTDVPFLLAGDRGFDGALDTYCPDCEVVETVEFVGTDLGPGLQEKVEQALARHPEANAVVAPYDAAALSVAPAVVGSGRKDDIFVMGGEGTAPVVDLVSEGRGVNAGVLYAAQWESWASLDAMNRLLAGETPDAGGFPSGMGAQAYDATRNLPDDDAAFIGPVNFMSAYLEAWGIETG